MHKEFKSIKWKSHVSYDLNYDRESHVYIKLTLAITTFAYILLAYNVCFHAKA